MLDHKSPLALAILFALFFFSVSFANPNQAHVAKFLQCLPTHSGSSMPILQSTYTPKDKNFTSFVSQYARNSRFLTPNTPKPIAIVVAKHESHVQASIICAKTNNLQIRVRSGGHDYEGLSYVSHVPFVIVDMYELRAINIDIASETATVEVGANLGELYYRIAEKSKVHAFPGGVCLTLGLGGFITGGGYGNLMRKYGLSVDNVIDAHIVDVNGKILDRKTMGEDLFWAIRGGGAESFGVILSWKVKLVRVPEIVTVFNVVRTLQQGATDLFYKWQMIATKLPKELFIRAMPQVVQGPQNGEKHVEIRFVGMFLGSPQALLPIMNKSFPELRYQHNDSIPTSWVKSSLFWYDLPIDTPLKSMLNRPQSGSVLTKSRSDYLDRPLEKSVIDTMWKKMIQNNLTWIQVNPYGGKISEIPATATPFPHRSGNMFLVQYFSIWGDEKDTDFFLNESKKFHDFMTPYVTKYPREAFRNYRDIDVGSNPSNATNMRNAKVYGSSYYKGNFDRLVRVKSMVDPQNFFKNEQSIPPK